MKALIDPRSNRVCQVADAEFPVAPPLVWVDCDETVVPDVTTYVDGAFVQPVEPMAKGSGGE